MIQLSQTALLSTAPRLVVAFTLLFIAAPNARSAGIEIEIEKSKRLLIVRQGEEVRRVFHVATGRGGHGTKRRLGDKKTPEGTYRVIGFNDRSKFEYFVGLNYPNIKDALYGLKNELINRDEFDRIIKALRAGKTPPQNTALGGAIGIHGLGKETPEKIHIHDNLDWTEGCIAMRNEEVHELRKFLRVGTRVKIRQ